MDKIEYLNSRINSDDNLPYCGPRSLFKFRPFDKFTFDMLENEYLYLCPAEKEDDKTECLTTIDFNRLIDLKNNNLKKECVSQIIDLIKPYTSKENFEMAKAKILSISRENGLVPANYMLELSAELEEMVPPSFNVAPFVNWIVNIPEFLDRPEIKSQLKTLFMTAYNARKETGICSLTESNDNLSMWEEYSAKSTGYCIEYDLSNYELAKNVLPVIYQDDRETNILIQLISSFIGQMITNISNGQIKADASHFIRLFLTKSKMYEYQKEWRYIGYANEKPKASKIKSIYIGKNANFKDLEAMIEFAKTKSIKILKL